MKICTKCGYQYPDNEAFCGNCGNALVSGQPVPMGSPQPYNQQPAYQIRPLPAKKSLWKWKLWIGTSEVLLGVFLLVCFCMIPYEMKRAELNTMPEQIAQVEVIETNRHSSSGNASYSIYFKFPDETEKKFSVEWEYYSIISKGEKGTLFYKERSNKNNVDNRLFIRFEKDSAND